MMESLAQKLKIKYKPLADKLREFAEDTKEGLATTKRMVGNIPDAMREVYGKAETAIPEIKNEASAMLSEEKPIEMPKVVEQKLSSIPKEKLVFQEHGVNSGIPYVDTDSGRKRIDEIDFQPEQTQRIKKITMSDPDKKHGGTWVIDKPEQLAVANEIKRYADAVAPEYTDYLLRLAQREGAYNAKQRNQNIDKKTGLATSTDRGIFQINDKSFPSVTDEMADDIKFSVLWAISLIEAGKQDKWVADPHVKRTKSSIEYE